MCEERAKQGKEIGYLFNRKECVVSCKDWKFIRTWARRDEDFILLGYVPYFNNSQGWWLRVVAQVVHALLLIWVWCEGGRPRGRACPPNERLNSELAALPPQITRGLAWYLALMETLISNDKRPTAVERVLLHSNPWLFIIPNTLSMEPTLRNLGAHSEVTRRRY